jgi:formylglycine-generating enzyme required for sulfatase activity
MFEFRPGVRQELWPTIRRSEIEQQVRNAVSDLIGQHIGSVREFIALIQDSKGRERLPVAAEYALFFAEITLPVLRQMGYEVDDGDGDGAVETQIPMPLGADGSPSVITPVSFEFRTARLKPDGKFQKLDTGHAWQFIEQIGSASLEMVFIPGGKFMMGGDKYDNEKPPHEVTVPAFYIGKFTVTQTQWRAVAALPKIKIELNPNPSNFKGDNRPVEQISWHDAREFCARLANHTGRLYRLPSEAEWEYACRAGTTTPFAFGETIINKVVNYNDKETIEVGSLGVANDFGLFDMHGNVWEWCEDGWHNSYESAPIDGSAWLSGGDSSYRVVRGGSWDLNRGICRSAVRSGIEPGDRYVNVGFRVVVSARN